MAELIAPPTPLYLRELLAQWEQHARQLTGDAPLMDQAGAAAARVALEMAGQRRGRITIVAGAGNNGGDGLETAACLLRLGIACRVIGLVDASSYKGDAKRAFERFAAASGVLEAATSDFGDAAVLVDAIYGTGLSRPPEGAASDAIRAINAAQDAGVPVLALDLPSGLVSDTGATFGEVVKACRTLTFLGLKPGLLTGAGPDCAGRIQIEPLAPAIDLLTPGFVNGPGAFWQLLARRKLDSNKGSFGTLAVIGGAHGTVGAALLASRASLYTGAGKVFVQTLGDTSLVVDLLHPELMLRAKVDLEHVDAVVIGPGLGETADAHQVLSHVIESRLPVVFDADALNLIAKDPSLQQATAPAPGAKHHHAASARGIKAAPGRPKESAG